MPVDVDASDDDEGVDGAGLHFLEAAPSVAAGSSLVSTVFPTPAPAPAISNAVVGDPSFLDLSRIRGHPGDIEEGSNAESSSWNSHPSSRVGGCEMVRESLGEEGAGGGVVGRDGGGGWLGRRGSGDRERITTVVVTRLEALQVEIVEVSRARVIK